MRGQTHTPTQRRGGEKFPTGISTPTSHRNMRVEHAYNIIKNTIEFATRHM